MENGSSEKSASELIQTQVGLTVTAEELTLIGRELQNNEYSTQSEDDARWTATDCFLYVMPEHLKGRQELNVLAATDYVTVSDSASTDSEVRKGLWVDLEEWFLYFSKDAQGHNSYKNPQLSTESVNPGLKAGKPFLKAARQARLRKVKEALELAGEENGRH